MMDDRCNHSIVMSKAKCRILEGLAFHRILEGLAFHTCVRLCVRVWEGGGSLLYVHAYMHSVASKF